MCHLTNQRSISELSFAKCKLLRVILIGLSFAISGYAIAGTPEEGAIDYIDSSMGANPGEACEFLSPTAIKSIDALMIWVADAILKNGRSDDDLDPELLFGKGKTASDIKRMIPMERCKGFFAAIMQQIRQANINMADFEIIGTVRENSTLAHVVYRFTINKVEFTDLISMERTGNSWGALLKGDMMNLIRSIASEFN